MRKIKIVVLGMVACVLLIQQLFAQRVTPLIQQTKTEQVQLMPGAMIRLDDSYGELTIEGWNRPELEITVIKTLPYDTDPSKSAKDLDTVQVSTERKSDKEVVISTKVAKHRGLFPPVSRPKAEVWVEYQIRAPRDAKLAIHHENGSVTVNNMASDVQAESSTGDIVVILPQPESSFVDAKTAFGTVVSDFGDTRNAHFVGRSFINGTNSSSPVIRLRMGYGGITVKTLPKEAYTADQ